MLWLLRHAGCRSFLFHCSWQACKQERLACVSLVLHLWIQPAVQTTVCPEQSQHLFLLFFPKECSMPSMSMVFTLLWVEAIYSKRCGLCANIVLSSWGLGLKLWAAFPMGLSHLTVPKFTVPERHQAMLLCCVLLAWLWRFLPFWALFSLPWNIGALRDSWTSFLKITFILCLLVFWLHVYMVTTYRPGCQTPWDWSMGGWEPNLGRSFARATCALDHWAISPVPDILSAVQGGCHSV